ncbi:MAG: TlpA family protein disulfide reductase [Anaerolineaceae bacterium]|nr:TlpA family protein disulfide reductase [Anaerolineaceae bacterium]
MKSTFYKNNFFSLVLIIVASIWIYFTITINQENSDTVYSAPQKGFIAPDFVLNDLNGIQYQLSNLKGNMIIVNVWASWCKPCQYEMPAMQKIYDKYKEDGLIILAVNNTSQDNYSDVLDFVSENNLTFPILLDLEGSVSKQYQVQALPSTFFIDITGKISEVVIGGPISETLIESKIKELQK